MPFDRFLPGLHPGPRRSEDRIAAGEILLGYPNAYGRPPITPLWDDHDLGRNGTYLVFRKLQQDVAGFWSWIAGHARRLAGGDIAAATLLTELIGAKLVGRWRSGASLVLTPDHDDPAYATPDRVNAFKYLAHDPNGLRCPISSHVRRANPRDARGGTAESSETVVSRHRILRRGRSYGSPLPYDAALAGRDDGVARGLYFISLQSSIARGFEFIQQTWLANPGFAGLHVEPDPIVGDSAGRCHITIHAEPVRLRLDCVRPSSPTSAAATSFCRRSRRSRGSRPARSPAIPTPPAATVARCPPCRADGLWRRTAGRQYVQALRLSRFPRGTMVAVPPLGPSKHAVALATWHHLPLRVRAAVPLSDDELFELCQVNRDLRIERTPDGEIWVMPPTGGETGRRNSALIAQLDRWSELDSSGVSFDSSTGFILPNGAERSPDAAWVTRTRWQALGAEDRAKFPPICPDFVIELRSRTDELGNLRAKMEEYRGCGARLGWLIDPVERRVHIYRPGTEVETLDAPATVTGDPVLRGFVLDLRRIW